MTDGNTKSERLYPHVENVGHGSVKIFYSKTHWTIVSESRAMEILGISSADGQGIQVIARDPNKHDQEKWDKFYGPIFDGSSSAPPRDFRCNEELAHPVAAKEWPDYYKGEGRQGPRPFRSMSERREYLRRYGFGES